MSLRDADIHQFSESFTTGLPRGWALVVNGRERFGSWEWMADSWPDKRRPRAWAVLAVTPIEAQEHHATRVVSEGWAGAEMRQRFTRLRIAGIELDLDPESVGDRDEVVRAQTAMAVRQATQLRASDIGSTYVPLELVERRAPHRLPDPGERASGVEPTQLTADWRGLFRGRPEISLGEAVEALGRSPTAVLELALEAVREGRLRLEQRGREIYLRATASELGP